MTAETAANILWPVWYASWIAAVVWSARTKTQMKTDMGGLHRYLSAIGCVLLFLPSHLARPLSDPAILGWWTRKDWLAPAWADWVLVVLVAAGFGFCWWARLHLGRLWSGFVTLKEDHHVVDTGPYGLVRHPIYAGVMFAALMTALLRATPVSVAGFVLLAIGFSLTARIEERFLRQQLGPDAYDAYSRKVPMLVPLVR